MSDRKPEQTMPKDSAARKNIPITSGLLDYFPAACAKVAMLSKLGNDKHNPGEPLHWARGKSMDHADCIGRHLIDRGVIDPDTGLSHTVEVAWRALALLQEEEEANGAPMARGAKLVQEHPPAFVTGLSAADFFQHAQPGAVLRVAGSAASETPAQREARIEKSSFGYSG